MGRDGGEIRETRLLPDEQLELVLDGDLGEEDNITKLYTQVLEMSFREVKGRALETTRLVIAAMVLAKVPFRREDLHKLVGQPDVSVQYILREIVLSVIAIGTSDQRAFEFGHLSFIEFPGCVMPNACPGTVRHRQE